MALFSHDFLQKLFELITNALSTLLLIVLIYILLYVIEMDFVCSCTHVTIIDHNGVLYMLVPPLILTGVVTAIESFRGRSVIPRWQRLCQTSVCCSVVKLVISYVGLTAVWAISVLIDGDWFFCLMTNRNFSQTGLPCKNKLSDEENIIKAAYESTSHIAGFWCGTGLFLLWIIYELFCERKKYKCWGLLERCSKPYYKVIYEDLLAEHVHSRLEDELTKIATKRAEAICAPHLDAIERHEQPLPETCVETDIQKVWSEISVIDFYLRKSGRPDDSHAGAETLSPQEHLPEGVDSAEHEETRDVVTSGTFTRGGGLC